MIKISQFLLPGLLAVGLHASPIVYMVTQGVNPGINGSSLANCPTQGNNACGSFLALLDTTTGTASSYNPITGLLANEEIFDIATNAIGEVYGVSATSLYRINTNNAVASIVATLSGIGVPTLNSLAFDPNGVLFAAGGNGNLYTVDTGTAAANSVGTWASGGQAGFQAGGDVAFVGTRLFLANNNNQIVELNPNSALVLNTSQIGLGANIQTLKGLAQADGSACGSATPTCLYVAADFNNGGGVPNINLVDIGAGANFGNILNTSISILPIGNGGVPQYGFPAGLSDFAQVPEPSVITLSLLGLGMIAWARRKTHS